MQDRAETAMPLFSLFSGGTAHGCTEDDDYDVDDVEVLQLVSLIDSRRRPEGSSGARCKTTGARAEARAVGTTQPLAPEVSFGHLGHGVGVVVEGCASSSSSSVASVAIERGWLGC